MVIMDFRKINISEETVVTIGNFDGVHKGHRFLMEKTKEAAAETGRKSVVLTFSPHPRDFFGGEGLLLITTDSERAVIFDRLGIDYKVFVNFDKELSDLSPELFIDAVLVNALNCRHVIIGENFSFGKDKAGNAELLKGLCASRGIKVDICSSVSDRVEIISSARIRSLISAGGIEEANHLLGEPYFTYGEVIRGNSLGRKLGFPTINQVVEANKLLPKNGVFFTEATIDGNCYNGITNVGIRPTFGGLDKTVETYLFDFNEDVYGKNVTIRFLYRSRDEIKFGSKEELKSAIEVDKRAAADFFRRMAGKG